MSKADPLVSARRHLEDFYHAMTSHAVASGEYPSSQIDTSAQIARLETDKLEAVFYSLLVYLGEHVAVQDGLEAAFQTQVEYIAETCRKFRVER